MLLLITKQRRYEVCQDHQQICYDIIYSVPKKDLQGKVIPSCDPNFNKYMQALKKMFPSNQSLTDAKLATPKELSIIET